jgi:transcription antitermination factor NusG
MVRWCILRTGGKRTLRLADSLALSGFEVWTPRETIRKRLPRRKAKADHTIPIMPTFVFANAAQLTDLAALAMRKNKAQPDFSVQQYNRCYPLIDDHELDPLRVAERKGTPLEQVRQFTHGETVKLTEGGFAGMAGIVQTSDGKHTMVCFPGFTIPIKISTLHLLPDGVNKDQIAA